ncbi:MAG TPA: inorganic phosphate transporter [Candidatus Limisoma intestinavium]|uniref:Phosphate transporter n=1 Tax=Candidatus Limisoma intestinavium TaxID=2840856 RepID=A0A9D1LHT2_9BACT|nr:inorganic phosphate transporter [Candidatus Limisoma intestinavium]
MSPIFTIIVVILAVLAILDLIVGVSNDAINFLNSALGSKVAKRWVILVVASAGILLGVLTSNGMMEVARNGVFHPGMFSFENIMFLFVAVMLSDVVLLNTFNALGLPTSTTVSLVFELLGASLAVAMFTIWNSPDLSFADLGQYINAGKAMIIISGILSSVVLAFAMGAILMYISRLIFSFKYNRTIRRYGAVWCGISIVGIVYFAIFKGMKSSGLISPEFTLLINEHIGMALLAVWVISSALLWVLQRLGVNIMKITILAGTFALALAFAGNDLVNFIGVPMAGLDSYMIASEANDVGMMMSQLAEPAHVNVWFLLISGIVMIVTLFVSKDAMKVAETQLNLSSQNEEEERFGSTKISRALVSMAMNLNNVYKSVVPQRIQKKLNSRFVPDEHADTSVSYDMIRAVVNLTAAASLICLGTSLKLPLSTTYVIFMVSMGSSLADRAWGRDSAVYRITGVMVVIMGWFITALGAITLAFLSGLLLMWGGWIALAGLCLLCGYILCHNLIFKKKDKEKKSEEINIIHDGECDSDVLYSCTQEVCTTMEQVSSIYNHMLVALFTENRRLLKETMTESEDLYHQANQRKYHIMKTLKMLQDHNVETGHFYIQVVDYLTEVSKALLHCTRPAYQHIENHHRGLTKEQIMDLKLVNDGVDNIFSKINSMLREKNFSDLDEVLTMRDSLFGVIAQAIKNQIYRLKEGNMSTKASMLYLNILNETKTMVLQSRNLIKSQGYFLSMIADADKGKEPPVLQPDSAV